MLVRTRPETRRLHRRTFLGLIGGGSGGVALLAACGAATGNATASSATTAASPTTATASQRATVAAVTGSTTTTSTSAVATKVAAAPTQLGYMAWGSEQEKQATTDVLAVFMNSNPSIQVAYSYVPQDYDNKLQSLIAAGTAPDVFKTSATLYPSLVKNGALRDITANIAQDRVIGTPDYFIEPFERNRSTIGGKWYGIGSCAQFGVLYYNVDVLQGAGVSSPSSDPTKALIWDQFVQAGAQLTKRQGNQVTPWGVYYPTGDWLYAALSNGGRDVDPATGKYVLDQPATVEAIQAVADLALKHRVAPDAAAFKAAGGDAWKMLAAGKVGMIMDGNWALLDLAKLNFKLGVAVLPKLKQPATLMQSSLTGINSKTAHNDEAWQFFQYLNLDAYQIQLVKVGLYGVSHTDLLTTDGVKKWLTPGVHPGGWAQLETDFKVKDGLAQTVPLGAAKAAAAISAALAPVWTGKTTAHDACATATAQANAIVAQV